MDNRSSLPKSPFKSRSDLRRALTRASAVAAMAMLLGSQNAKAAVRTWVGSTSANWAGPTGFDTTPASGDSLVFGVDGAAGMATTPPDTLTNTLTSSAFNIAGITFNSGAPAYTMTGNTFNLTAGITNNSGLLQTFSNTGGLFTTVGTTYATGTGGISLSGLTFVGGGQTTTVTGAGGLTIAALTLNNGARVNQTFNGAGNVTIGSTVGGTGGNSTLTYSGTGTLTINGVGSVNSVNTQDGVTSGTFLLASGGSLSQGISTSGSGVFTENAGGMLINDSPITQGSTGIMTLAGTNSNSSPTTVNSGTLNLSGAGTISGGTVITVNAGAFNESGGAVISAGSTFTTNGGTTTLSGLNTFTGATSVNGGTLTLDFSGATTPASANNIIKTGNTVNLGGGSLVLKGGGTGTNSQTFGTTALTATTASTITTNVNGGTALNLALGGITRNSQSTVDVTFNTGTGTVTTTATGGTGGLLGDTNNVAYATANGGTSFVAKGGTTPFTLSALPTSSYTNTYATGNNVDVVNGDSQTGVTVNTLRFNTASDGLTLAGTNILNSAAILVTPTGGGSGIAGGTITSTNGAAEVVIHDYSSFNEGAIIANANAGATATKLTLDGTGTTTLSAANTITGQTTLLTGTLNLANQLALQNSNLQVNTGTSLVFNSSVTGNAFTLGGLSGAGNVALLNNATPTPAAIALTVGNNNSTGSYSGILSGALGTVTKVGTGTQTFSGANTYTGGTTINAGTVTAANNAALGTGTITLAGGKLTDDATARTLANALSVTGTTGELATTGGGNFTINGAVTGTGTFNVGTSPSGGASSVVLGNNLNGFTGTVSFTGNTIDNLIFTSVLNTTAKFSLSGATGSQQIYLNAVGSNTIGELSGTGGKISNNNGATTLLVNQTSTTTYSGNLINGSAALSLTKANTGSLSLTFASPYTGVTTVTGGILSTGTTGILANGGTSSSIGASTNAAANLVLNGGTLQYANTGAAESTDRLFTVGSTVAGGTGTLDASGTNAINFTNTGAIAYGTTNQTRTLGLTGTSTAANTLAPLIGNNGTGMVSVTKSGAGSWTLTNANTYTGATTVSGGTLSLAKTGTAGSVTGGTLAASATGIAVNTGGTLLVAASNAVGNTTPVNLGGGTFSAAGGVNQGAGAHTDTGTVAGNVTTGGTVTGTPATSTLGLGALTLSGNSTLNFAGGGVSTLVFTTFDPSASNFTLNVTGYTTTAVQGSGSSGTDGADDRIVFDEALNAAQLADITFNGVANATEVQLDGGFYEVIGAVPEPSTYLGGLLLAVGAAWRLRRRARRVQG